MGSGTNISHCTISLGDTVCERTYKLLQMHILDSKSKRPPLNDERRLSAQAKVWPLATQCGCEWHVEISSLYLSYVVIKTQLLRGT
jgi:hypothetical protein